MGVLIPIKYGKRNYPPEIKPSIQEVAGHFDVKTLSLEMEYSLHTEYSYGPRKLNRPALDNLKTIQESHNNGIPRLWYNQHWAVEFFQFIRDITENKPPTIIEIHPPFDDYCGSIHNFIERYQVFENKLISLYPDTKIFLENRCGSLYKGGGFIISTVENLLTLGELIEKYCLRLRVALDLPQLISAYGGITRFNDKKLHDLFRSISSCRDIIHGIHLWGKKLNDKGHWVSHVGNFNTYFDGNTELKKSFLSNMYELFDDDNPRYIVLEVNSNDEDIHSIVHDLLQAKFLFV